MVKRKETEGRMNRNKVILVREKDKSNRDEVSSISCDLPQQLPAAVAETTGHGGKVWPMGVVKWDPGPFYSGIYPVILPLKICGLHSSPCGSPTISVCRRINVFRIYSFFIIFVTGVQFLRSVIIYSTDESFGEELFFKLQQSVWYLECFVKACAIWTAWYRKKRLTEFFDRWTAVCGVVPTRKSVRRFAFCISAIAIGFVFCNAFGSAFVFFHVEYLEKILLTTIQPIEANDDNKIWLKCLVIFMVTVESAVAMFPVAFMCVITFALYVEFKELASNVRKSLQDNGEFSGNLETIRLLHQRLCKLVEKADDSFNVIIAISYLSNIPNLCIVLYSILYFGQHYSLVIMNLFWFVFIVLHITSISVFGAWLNSAAHSPLSDIYSIRADTLSSYHQFEINMFLSKLNGGSIGLTAMQMFVINRPTILTVGSLLVTYFVLLVQFKSSTAAICTCNMSGMTGYLNQTFLVSNNAP